MLFRSTDVKAFGFQGHPEAGPGPTELAILFKHFLNLIDENIENNLEVKYAKEY